MTELADTVAMSSQAASNQLQRLAAQGIVGSQREGNMVRYRIIDPWVTNLLNQGLCLVEDAKGVRP